ncbi:MAG TPA: DUF4276 family protein [Candidatus Eisenbacteria bacterium]
MIQPIVEGHGEVEAVPVLLRRLRDEAGAFHLQVGGPIRRHRSQLVREESLCQAVELARRQAHCNAILILFDGDEDCPRDLAPRIQGWAAAASAGIPCSVVMAHREYEAWFLAAVESLRGQRGIRPDAAIPFDPEAPRGAKAALEDLMAADASYHETADQPALTAMFDMATAHRRSRSFRHMTSAFGSLLRAHGVQVDAWPPVSWATTSGARTDER